MSNFPTVNIYYIKWSCKYVSKLIISILQSVGFKFNFSGKTNRILDVTDSILSIKMFIWRRTPCFFKFNIGTLPFLYEGHFLQLSQLWLVRYNWNSSFFKYEWCFLQSSQLWSVSYKFLLKNVHLWFACVQNICTQKTMAHKRITLRFITTHIIKAHSNQLTSPGVGGKGI